MVVSAQPCEVRIGLCAALFIILGSWAPSSAQPLSKAPDVLPLTPAYAPVPGARTIKEFHNMVEWRGKEYDAREGTAVLMRVITDPESDAPQRAKALTRLGRFRNMDMTPQLVALYDRLSEREEKRAVIKCLIWSEDPRGLPLFVRIVEREADDRVRLTAAVALAQWNVRRGVAELIRIEGTCKERASADSDLCRGAANSFARLNTYKPWGFPDERVREELLSRPELDDVQRRALYVNEIKKWFAANEHRFPEWKPGDALPEVAPPKKGEDG